MAALEAALDIWDRVDIAALRAASITLSEMFLTGVQDRCPELRLASPRAAAHRGSQVSFHHPQGYAIMQALIAKGVIGDFRAPDILRFGFTPLYIGADEVRGGCRYFSTDHGGSVLGSAPISPSRSGHLKIPKNSRPSAVPAPHAPRPNRPPPDQRLQKAPAIPDQRRHSIPGATAPTN